MFYVRGGAAASILHLLPDSVARKTRKHTCFTSDAHPAVTPSEAVWCQKHTEALEDDGITWHSYRGRGEGDLLRNDGSGWERKKDEESRAGQKERRKLNDFLPPLRRMWCLQQMCERLKSSDHFDFLQEPDFWNLKYKRNSLSSLRFKVDGNIAFNAAHFCGRNLDYWPM